MEDLWQKALVFLGLKEPEEKEYLEENYPEEEFATVKKVPRESYPRRRAERPTPLRAVRSPSFQVHIFEPRLLNEVLRVAEKFKAGTPVIVNLNSADKATSQRIIDFVSGMVCSLDGKLLRITAGVYLATPRNVEIGPEEKARIKERFFKTV